MWQTIEASAKTLSATFFTLLHKESITMQDLRQDLRPHQDYGGGGDGGGWRGGRGAGGRGPPMGGRGRGDGADFRGGGSSSLGEEGYNSSTVEHYHQVLTDFPSSPFHKRP